MAVCRNGRCRAPLRDHHWGDGYCCQRCMATGRDYESGASGPLLDPNDPTGHHEICQNHAEVEAMLEARAIDHRLPRIIYLRKQGHTYRQIAAIMQPPTSHQTCYRLVLSVTPKLLRACGLRQ